MSSALVVVDGPNLYNDLARYIAKVAPNPAPVERRHAFFLQWFDVDRLVRATLEDHVMLDPWAGLGTVIFHSPKGLGGGGEGKETVDAGAGDTKASRRSPERLGDQTPEFWARQGCTPNTSVVRVDVPGEKEKGVDTSIVVYLYETQERWDVAVLFASDADYVPVVQALRRKGKRVYCSSPTTETAKALVQACQHFVPWNLEFVHSDLALYEALHKGGLVDSIVTSPAIAAKGPQVWIRGGALCIAGRNGAYSSEDFTALPVPDDQPYLRFDALGNGVLGVMPSEKPKLALEGVSRHVSLFEGAAWLPLMT